MAAAICQPMQITFDCKAEGNKGPWSQSTTYRQDIKRSLFLGFRRIAERLNRKPNVQLRISAQHALAMCESQEMLDYAHAPTVARLDVDVCFDLFHGNGLPRCIFGIDVEIEETTRPYLKTVEGDCELYYEGAF